MMGTSPMAVDNKSTASPTTEPGHHGGPPLVINEMHSNDDSITQYSNSASRTSLAAAKARHRLQLRNRHLHPSPPRQDYPLPPPPWNIPPPQAPPPHHFQFLPALPLTPSPHKQPNDSIPAVPQSPIAAAADNIRASHAGHQAATPTFRAPPPWRPPPNYKHKARYDTDKVNQDTSLHPLNEDVMTDGVAQLLCKYPPHRLRHQHSLSNTACI